MFEIGEKVVYGVLGACEIIDIATPPIKGIEGRYYFLQPLCDDTGIIYSPVESNTTLAMRDIVTEKEAKHLLNKAKNCKADEELNEKIYQSEYDNIVKSQNLEELMHMVRYLYNIKNERAKDLRKMKSIDARMLTVSKKLLYGEMAVSLGRELDDVTAELDEYLAVK